MKRVEIETSENMVLLIFIISVLRCLNYEFKGNILQFTYGFEVKSFIASTYKGVGKYLTIYVS